MAQNEADLDLDVEAAEAPPKQTGWLKYVLFGVVAVALLLHYAEAHHALSNL